MKKSQIVLIISTILCFLLAYLFINRGLNITIKNSISYKEESNVDYKVNLLDNDIFDEKVLDKDNKYISELVDTIDIDYNYKIDYEKDISGYYTYIVDSKLVIYEDNIKDIILEKDYNEKTGIVKTLDKNNINNITINDTLNIDYKKYRNEVINFNKNMDIEGKAYLLVTIKINKKIDFKGHKKNFNNSKYIDIIIPLMNKTFKISIVNDGEEIDEYYEYTKKSNVNYLLIFFGLLIGSIALTLTIFIIRDMINIYHKEDKYNKNLRKILKEYEDIIVNVDKLYNKKKYNLIYVDNFKELLDVYNKVNSPISYKEVSKGKEAIFLIIEDDNAWIYRLCMKNL